MLPSPSPQLDVYWADECVGTLHDGSLLAFEYAPTWLRRTPPLPLADMPLQLGRNDTAAVQSFFENLLPEGELRQHLMEQKKASTLFALLREVAGDTVGGFTLLPAGQAPEAPRYEATSWPELASRLGRPASTAIDLQGQHTRISLAGAQDKTSIALFADGIPRLPLGTSPSTHILKPNIRRLTKVWHSAANETLVMRTAAHCGLPTAEVFYEPLTQSCVVRRFDRTLRPDGSLGRIIQYDLCQLAHTMSEKKYEKEGGPSIASCATLIRQHSSQPAVDLRLLVSWIMFNLYTGNNDSHAKNLSLYRPPGQGPQLTPFYDLMCTRLYPGLSPEFAFAIGGETQPGRITASHIATMAAELGIRPRFVSQIAADLAHKIPAALTQAVAEVSPTLPHSAQVLAERLQQFILSTTRKTAARLM